MRSTVLPVLSLCIVQALGQANIKGSLARCLSGSGDLSSCLAKLAEDLRPYMPTGIPELNIPKTEPMFIPRVLFAVNKPPVDVNIEFQDMTVTGLSTFILNSVEADRAASTITMDLTVPELRSNGRYNMTGVAFVVLEDSFGPFKSEMKNVNVVVKSQLTKSNGKLLIVDDPDIVIKSASTNVEFDNLFGGKQPQFSKIIHEFINENDNKKFTNEIGPQITKQVAAMAKGLYNQAVADLDPSVFGLN